MLLFKPNIEKLMAKGKVLALCKALTSSGDSDIRLEAAKALRAIGDRQAVEPLITALKDQDQYVGDIAAKALEKIAPDWRKSDAAKRAVPMLITDMKDNHEYVRWLAARTLGRIQDTRAVEPLIAALETDSDWRVRNESAKALGEIKDVRAAEPLIAALKVVGEAAAVALEQIDPDWRESDAAQNTVPLFIADLNDNGEYAAAYALGETKDVRAVEPLIAALKYWKYSVREAAAEALGKIKDIRAVEPLIGALKDYTEDNEYRPTIKPLLAALKDRSRGSVRTLAAWALGEIKDVRAVEPLSGALKDGDEDIRRVAAEALKKITGKDYTVE